MGNVGLLFVGAVLFLNGVILLGWVEAKSAAPINFFVGVLQVVTPTYLIFTANGDANVILAAAGLYLFGFTYLYSGVNLAFDLDGAGLGYFCASVVVCVLAYSGLNFIRFQDNGFGMIWPYWAFLWALFFLVLGLKRDGLTRCTGAVCAIQGWVTGTVPSCSSAAALQREREHCGDHSRRVRGDRIRPAVPEAASRDPGPSAAIDRQRRAGRQLELTVMTSADSGVPCLVVSLGTAHQLIA
ncbi:MAG TPA: AmiS/UreI family transporter [Kribbella sp.]